MKHFSKSLSIIAVNFLLIFGVASALTNANNLTVTNVTTHLGGGYLTFSAALGGTNTCGGPTNMLAFSNDDDGKAFLSVGLTALTTKKTVAVYSNKICAPHQLNVEEMRSIEIR